MKKGIADARRSGRGARRAQALVVGASMAATLMGWAFFSHEDAQTDTTAQEATPTAIVTTAQQSTTTSTSSASSTVQATPTATATLTTTTTAASTAQTIASSTLPQAIASTRSSQ